MAINLEKKPDKPDDVEGGLKLALMQDWTEDAVKRAVLICDAPAHGYYKQKVNDNFPEGTPDVPSLKELTEEFNRKEITL